MKLKIREIAIFAMLGAVMFVSKVVMEGFPNIHLLGTFVITFTLVYRAKALFPIYAYVFANGFWEGFNPFGWLPELYLWLILWGIVMLLPQNIPARLALPIYMVISALHGLLFDVFYAPAYVIFGRYSWSDLGLILIAGIPFNVLHAVGNFALGSLIIPLATILKKLDKNL